MVLKSFLVPPVEETRIGTALKPFTEMFTEAPGSVNLLTHRIDIGSARPTCFNSRPLSVHKGALLASALEETVATGAVGPSKRLFQLS
ncbi:hypothetical protein HPB49_021040 [Dermacentor silvarum]|uniref:Uncharacterized protein n=1 Tax=Dermacentor silvarum TaxID=543639 RepID=A0ACB8CHG5_DERSI|nr:hypothetical protein HPB49_021040 [Dermacentor silvarum]